MNISVKKLILSGLFVCMTIVLRNYLSIHMPNIRINFSFLPISMCSVMIGPFWGGIAALVADLLGFLIGTHHAAFFPGYSLNAFLSGWVYGIFLYKKRKSVLRIGITCFIVCIFINVIMGTYWASILFGQAFIVLLPPRLIVNLIMIPVQTVVIYWICKGLSQRMNLENI